MPYVVPHRRSKGPLAPKAVADPNLKSVTEFPTLGKAVVKTSTTPVVTSFAEHAKRWSETVKVDEAREVLKKKVAEQKAWDRIDRMWRNNPYVTPYIRADDLEQDRLDELEYYEALEWEAANPGTSHVQVWISPDERRNRVWTPEPSDDEYEEDVDTITDEEIRQRITFVTKRMRRNDILREDREACEKEVQDLQKLLYESD